MKAIYPIVIAITPLAIVVGLLTLPSHEERSEQFLHDGRFEAAEPLLETRFREGDRSPRVVDGIVRARFSQGDVQGAIDFMELVGLGAHVPHSLVKEYEAGLKASFGFDRYRKIKSPDNSSDTLRELSLLADLGGDRNAERDNLERLVNSERATSGEIVRLAMIECQNENYIGAFGRLDNLASVYPDNVTSGSIELMAHVAMAGGEDLKAPLERRVTEYLERRGQNDAAQQIGWILIESGFPDVAASTLLARGDSVFRDGKLLEALSAALAASGRQAELVRTVERNLQNGALTEKSLSTLVAAKIFDRSLLAAVAGAYSHDKLRLTDQFAEQLASVANEVFHDREITIQFLRKISSQNGPHHPATRSLVFMWSPVADASDLDWLVSRVNVATPQDKLNWLEHLINVGGEDRVVKLLSEAGGHDAQGIGAFALRVIPNGLRKETVDQLFALALTSEKSSEELLRLAVQAKNLRDYGTAESLVRRSIELGKSPAASQAFLVTLLVELNRAVEAREILQSLVGNKKSMVSLPNVVQARLYYFWGTAEESAGAESSASSAFQQGFAQYRPVSKASEDRHLYVELMAKVEGQEAAAGWLAEAAKVKPLNSNERLLLGKLYTELKMFAEAKKILFEENKS